MAKRAPARKPFVMTVALAVGGAVGGAAGCGGQVDVTYNPPAPDAEVRDTATSDSDPGACPGSAPSAGTACSGDLSCGYRRCIAPTWQDDIRAECVAGAWRWVSTSICNPPPPECPATEPAVGSDCYLPLGKPCTYGDKCSPTGTKVYGCQGGAWKVTMATTTACPATRPADGSACGGCAARCTYGDCYGTPTIDATCNATTGTWQVIETSCNPPPPPLDGGGA